MSSLEHWLTDLLRRHDLSQPDGRDLHRYDLGEEHFEELGRLLRERAAETGAPNPVDAFWKGYLVYAALYFSFRHTGVWRWDPIDEVLGLDERQTVGRTDGICRAARWFGRAGSIQPSGKRFIGFAFFEGGLPTKAIQEHDPVYYARLTRAVHHLQKFRIPPENLRRWIREDIENESILSSVDPDVVCNALTQGALALSGLLARTKTMSVSALAADEGLYEEFNEQFPCFRISKEKFRQFLEDVSTDVSSHDTKEFLRIERILKQSGTAFTMSLRASVRTGAKISSLDDFALLTGLRKRDLPRPAEGQIFCNGTCLAKVKIIPAAVQDEGPDATVRILPMRDYAATGAQALQPLLVELRFRNKETFQIQTLPPAAMGLSPDEPTVFRVDPADAARWKIMGSGSAQIPGEEAMFCVREDAVIKPSEASAPTRVGEIEGLGVLWRFDAPLKVRVDDATYRMDFRVGTTDLFVWSGELFGVSREGLPIYRGVPELMRHGAANGVARAKGQWFEGRQPVFEPAADRTGRYVFRVEAPDEEGIVVKRLSVIVTPRGADIRQRVSGRGKNPSEVRLSGWGLEGVAAEADGDDRTEETETLEPVAERTADGDVVVRCPLPRNPATAFSRSLTLKCLTSKGDEFTIRREYPIVAHCFVLDGRALEREETISLTDIRRLKARVLKNDASPVELEIYPENFQELSDQREADTSFILRVRMDVDPKTNVGILGYEDFRSAFYRVQRLVNHSRKFVVMRLLDGNRAFRIQVQPFAGHFDSTVWNNQHAVRFESEKADKFSLTNAEIIPLYPELSNIEPPPPFTVATGFCHTLSDAFDRTQTPWVVRAEGDKTYVVKPHVVVPSGMLFPQRMSFLSSAPVWIDVPDDRQAEEFLQRMESDLRDPFRPQWKASLDMVRRLGTRGFALLPIWNTLRRRVPLAFSYAVVIDWLRAEGDGRSFLRELGRNQAWRWELISMKALEREVARLDGFLKGMNLPKGGRERLFQAMLENPAVLQAPGLREKLAFLVWNRTFDPAMLQILKRTPFWALNASAYECGELLKDGANELILQDEADDGQVSQGTAEREMFGRLLAAWLPPSVGQGMGRRLQKVSGLLRERPHLLSTLYAAFLWAALDSGIPPEEDPTNYERLKQICRKEFYFRMENAFERNPEWTAWCHIVAAALFWESGRASSGR